MIEITEEVLDALRLLLTRVEMIEERVTLLEDRLREDDY